MDHPPDGMLKHWVTASSFRLSVTPLAVGSPTSVLRLPGSSFTSHSTFRDVAPSGFFTRKMWVATVSWGVAGVQGQLFVAWVQGFGAWVGMLPAPLFVGVIAASEKSFRLLLVSLTRVRLIVVPLPAGLVSGGPEVGPPG